MKKVTVTVQGWPHKTENLAKSIKKAFERHAYQGKIEVKFLPAEEEVNPIEDLLTVIMEIEKAKNYPKNNSERGDVPRKESDGPRIIGDIWDDILSGNSSYGWKVKHGVMVPDQESFFDKEMAKQKDQFEKDSDTVSKILNSLNDINSFSGSEKELMSETLKEVLEDSVKVLLVKNRGNLKPVLDDIRVLLDAIKECNDI